MDHAARDVDEIAWFGVDRFAVPLEGGAALQHIKRLVVVMVKVRWRASPRRKQALADETTSVRVRARGQKADPVTRPAIHRPRSGGDILGLILTWHGFDSFLGCCVV